MSRPITTLALTLMLGVAPASALAANKNDVFFGPMVGGSALVAAKEEKTATLFSQVGVQADAHWDTGAGLDFVLNGQALVGGMEQGLVLPSLTVVVGMATDWNLQLGVGPSLSTGPQPLSMAISLAQEFRTSEGMLPLSLVVVPNAHGTTATVLLGYNFSTRRW